MFDDSWKDKSWEKIHIILGMIIGVSIKVEVVAKMTGIYGTWKYGSNEGR